MDDEQASDYEENIQAVHHLVQNATWMLEWPACHRMFCEGLAKKPSWFFKLPMISCIAVGGTAKDAVPVAAAWIALDHAAHLLDVVSDGDFVPDAAISTAGQAVNFAAGLIFSAYHFLSTIQDPDRARRVTRVFSESGYKATYGQHLSFDSHEELPVEDSLEQYWRTAISKSGSIFCMGAAGGAAVGTADENLIDAVGDYGTALGVIMQILDDCRDLLDIKTGRFEVTLPVLLYSLASGGKQVVFPPARSMEAMIADLQNAHVPEMIAALFQDWQKNALESLKPLNDSRMMNELEKMLPDASKLPF